MSTAVETIKAKHRWENTYLTPGALHAFLETGEVPATYLAKHWALEAGCLCSEDILENMRSLQSGGRILSAFHLKNGIKIYVITDGVDDEGIRRTCTCLLPEEY
ncbi:MAG TPA: hypothetical protein VK914_05770 [bacterium]|jgi:hypothetical protein|nr:hypothetical protein [bacterium]